MIFIDALILCLYQLHCICGLLPLKYELACRKTCLNSVNSVVEFVARNGVLHACISLLAVQQFCSVLFEVHLHDLGGVNRGLAFQLYNRDMYCHKDDINVICKLLAVKHGDLELDLFSNSVSGAIIEFLCTN